MFALVAIALLCFTCFTCTTATAHDSGQSVLESPAQTVTQTVTETTIAPVVTYSAPVVYSSSGLQLQWSTAPRFTSSEHSPRFEPS
jgi:hypothetical protein